MVATLVSLYTYFRLFHNNVAKVFTAATLENHCAYGCIQIWAADVIEELGVDMVPVHVEFPMFFPCKLCGLEFRNTFSARDSMSG